MWASELSFLCVPVSTGSTPGARKLSVEINDPTPSLLAGITITLVLFDD